MDKRLLIILIVIAFLNILSVMSINKYDNVEDALKDYPSQGKHGKKAKFMTIKIAKEKWREIDYFSRILYQFFLSVGAKVHLVNMNDKELLGIYPADANIDKETVLDTFQGVIEDITFRDQMEK